MVNLPIQSGSNDPASDSEYLLPERKSKIEKYLNKLVKMFFV